MSVIVVELTEASYVLIFCCETASYMMVQTHKNKSKWSCYCWVTLRMNQMFVFLLSSSECCCQYITKLLEKSSGTETSSLREAEPIITGRSAHFKSKSTVHSSYFCLIHLLSINVQRSLWIAKEAYHCTGKHDKHFESWITQCQNTKRAGDNNNKHNVQAHRNYWNQFPRKDQLSMAEVFLMNIVVIHWTHCDMILRFFSFLQDYSIFYDDYQKETWQQTVWVCTVV